MGREFTLEKIAQIVSGRLIGSPGRMICGIASIADCRADEITFAVDDVFIEKAAAAKIGALLVNREIENFPHPQIIVSDPKMAAYQTAYSFAEDLTPAPGISDRASVDPTATLGKDVSLLPFAFVGPGAIVDDGSILHPFSHVGAGAKVGAYSQLHPGAVVGARCVVGSRCILHNNVSIGADGFGFDPDGQGGHMKNPQLGIVEIGDDVEIGACSCVDRATFGRTVVGDGTKIDNLVQIAHNCIIGKNAIIVAQAGMAGSLVVEDNVTIAGAASIIGHIRIGKGATIGPRAGVMLDVPAGAMVGGVPAVGHIQWKRQLNAVDRLPSALKELRRLEKRVAELEAALARTGKADKG